MALAVKQSSEDRPPTSPIKGTATPVESEEPTLAESDSGIPPTDTYRIAIDEYRFQAQFNWSRTQYLLAFNAAILAAASGLYVPAGVISLLVFALGGVAALSSLRVVTTQHGYYRAARDRMRRVEERLSIPMYLRFDTTKGLGGKREGASVNFVIKFLLWSIAAADGVGVLMNVGNLR